MNSTETMVADNLRCLQQGLRLLTEIGDELYRGEGHSHLGSGIGPHLRHTLDHYSSLLAGLPAGKIDYDARARNPRLERDREFARQQFEHLIAGFQQLTAPPDLPLTVKVDSGSHDDAANWSRSTLKRELQYLVSHTIHHYAIIAILLRAQGWEPSEEFGVAPSTLNYRKSLPACAP